jgi:chromosome segregation ATPase
VHRERLTAAERAVADLEAERGRLEGRRQAAAGACAEAEQELQLAGAAVEGAGQQAAAALAELQSAGAGGGAGEDAGAERSLQEARRKAGDAARAVTQVTTQLRELERQQEGFERQVVEAAEGQARAARSLEQTGSRLAGLEQAGSAAQERLARAQGARAEAAQARAEAQGRLETLTARAATLDREAEGLRARLDVLDSLLRSGDRKAQRPEVPDQGGQRLASRLQVPGDLEAAVAAAAGAALEWELVPTLGEARRRALALAADGERTTFVATERLALASANGAPGSLYAAVSR